jgi:ubiquinone/menaquinone biosynthesis C-methylase UbiE
MFVFDSMAKEYDSWFEKEGKIIFDIEVQALQQVVPLSSRPWLEIGVGSGRFALALKIDNGLDPSIELLKIAENRGINTLLGKGENIPFNNGVFGALFIITTLCFADSPSAMLKEANRILHKGGAMVLGTISPESPWGELYELKKRAGHHIYRHATFYRYAELENLLKNAGFSIEKVFSTLFQNPNEVKYMESPQEGILSNAGFIATLSRKN